MEQTPNDTTPHPAEGMIRPVPKYFPAFVAALAEQKGKTVVITGTTSGTGLVAAKTSLEKGATVFLLNRNSEKAKKSLQTFLDVHPSASGSVSFVECDLQSFASVEKAAEKVTSLCEEKKLECIDVLANNAGVMALEDKATVDGYDVQMQTNHLSHFLLTKLLFPLLVKSQAARVVNHSSFLRLTPTTLKAIYFGKNGGNLGGNGSKLVKGARWERYHQSKLANSVFTVELKKRLLKHKIKNVISVCAHPGFAFTELHATTTKDGGMASMEPMSGAQSMEDGSMGLLRGMFGQVQNGALYGPFLFKGKAKKRLHGPMTTSKAGKLLWTESEKACGVFEFNANNAI